MHLVIMGELAGQLVDDTLRIWPGVQLSIRQGWSSAWSGPWAMVHCGQVWPLVLGGVLIVLGSIVVVRGERVDASHVADATHALSLD